MLIQCQCGQQYNIKESMYGKVVRCKKCGTSLQIGYPAQEAQAVAPQPAPAPQPQYQQPQYLPPDPAVSQPGAYDPNAAAAPSPYGSPQASPYAPAPGYGQAQPYGSFPGTPVPGKRPKPKAIKYDFSKVNLGLRLIFAGTVTSILCAFGTFAFAFAGLLPMSLLTIAGVILGSIITTAGYVMCIFVPVETMARPLIIGSVVCQAINLLCTFANMMLGVRESSIFNLIGGIASVAAMTLFLLFLKKVAEFVGNNSAAHDAHSLAVFYWILIGIVFGFTVGIIPVAMIGQPIIAGAYLIIGGIGMFVAWLIWFVHFMTFINALEFKRSAPRRKKY